MSNATCASCGERIHKRTRFVIAGTEVFHPDCISNIPNSKLHRLADMTRNLRLEVDRAKFETEAAKETLRREVEVNRASRTAAKIELDWERTRNKEAVAELADLRREREQLQRALQSARAEVALQRALGPAVRTDANLDAAQDTRDPLEVRASLLELDLP